MSEQTPSARSKGFLRRNVWVLAAIGLLVIVVAGTSIQQLERSRATAEQEQQVKSLEAELTRTHDEADRVAETNSLEGLGISQQRLLDDRERIDELMRTALTFDDGASYDEARAELIERFGVDEDGEFLTEFMPESKAGSTHDVDRIGLVFTFDEVADVGVERVVTTKYHYVVEASTSVGRSDVKPGSDGSSPTETRRILLRLVVDGEGQVSEMSAVPASGPVLTAG